MKIDTMILIPTTYIVVQVICFVSSEPVDTAATGDDFFSEKLDWNKVKMTKLRLLLLGELFKHQIQQNDVPTVDLSCDSSTSQLNVNTKNCPCKSYSCRDLSVASNVIATNHNRNLHTTCKEYCCSLKFKRSVAPYHHESFENHHVLKKQPTCGRGQNVPFVEILKKRTNETLCSGVTLSRRVVLTTASCIYDISLQDLAIRISYTTMDGTMTSTYARLIRKMQHGKYRAGRLAQFDVALLVTERELKMWHLLTSNENDFYMCLPKGSLKIENGSTNCYVPSLELKLAAVDATTKYQKEEQLKEEVVAAAGKQQKSNHHQAIRKQYVSIYKAAECDKIVQTVERSKEQQQQDEDQSKVYLHNGSICGIVKDNFAIEDEQMLEHGNQQLLLAGLPLICTTAAAATTATGTTGEIVVDSSRRGVAATPPTLAANYFVQGLLAKFPSSDGGGTNNTNGVFVVPDAGNHEIRSRKSAFIFVNMAQYVDWINLQMEKLNSFLYA